MSGEYENAIVPAKNPGERRVRKTAASQAFMSASTALEPSHTLSNESPFEIESLTELGARGSEIEHELGVLPRDDFIAPVESERALGESRHIGVGGSYRDRINGNAESAGFRLYGAGVDMRLPESRRRGKRR